MLLLLFGFIKILVSVVFLTALVIALLLTSIFYITFITHMLGFIETSDYFANLNNKLTNKIKTIFKDKK